MKLEFDAEVFRWETRTQDWYFAAIPEEPSADIRSRYYGFSEGETLDYTYEIAGGTLTIWSGARGSPAYYEGTFSDDGTVITGAWHYPGGGGYATVTTRIDGDAS